MKIKPTTHEGYQLLHDGALALSQIEEHGIRVDMPYVEKTMASMGLKQKQLGRQLQEDPMWRRWQKKFGTKAKLTSDDQIGKLLYGEMGYPVTDRTDNGDPSTDEAALGKIDLPFVREWVRMKKYQKLRTTYLRGIAEEVDAKGYIHPVFNLHTTLTYRSSSNAPNFQNQPTRNDFMARAIRRSFLPSPGHVIVENDYSGVEVRVAACYHKDKVMLEYIKDETKDMHRDMAAQCFMLDPQWVKAQGKKHRGLAKGGFVFAQFYGAYYPLCANTLWEGAQTEKLLGPNGEPLREYLASKGITELGEVPERGSQKRKPDEGTFMRHIADVENDFWNNRFKTYGKWRKQHYEDYCDKGHFDTLTGFRLEGVFARNDVINYPVQGSAFHCLLRSVIDINKELKRAKMRSRVCGQIHDSCVGDVHREELRDYFDIVHEVMTQRIRKHYPWLIVPLDIEYEITPDNGTWYDKQGIIYNGTTFGIKDRLEALAKKEKVTTHTFETHKQLVRHMREQQTILNSKES